MFGPEYFDNCSGKRVEVGEDGTEVQAFLHLFINSNVLAAGLPSLLGHIDFWKEISIPVLTNQNCFYPGIY